MIFEKENINTLEADSEILITMLGAFAQAESESISANVRWGKRQAMREGKAIIQYDRLYAYEKGEDGNPKIIPEQAEVVRSIYNQYLTGASLRMIKSGWSAVNAERYTADVPGPGEAKSVWYDAVSAVWTMGPNTATTLPRWMRSLSSGRSSLLSIPS